MQRITAKGSLPKTEAPEPVTSSEQLSGNSDKLLGAECRLA